MAKKNIGATISLKDNGFKSGIKSAVSGLTSFKKGSEGATSSVKKFSSQTNSAGTSLASMAKKVVGVVAAYASMKQLVTWGKACIDAANTQASAEARLETLMMNVAGTTMENVSAMKKYAAELQGVTTVGDEVTIQGASQLATFQLQSDTIKTILPALQDLAVSQYGVAVSGDQMQSMANLVGKVMTGNVGALTRYGVTLNDAQSKILKTGTESERAAMLVEVLGQNFGGLAEAMANTPEGKVQQLKNAWSDMQEVIGTKLYPIVTTVLQYITTKLPAIQSAFTTVVNVITPGIQGVTLFATTMIDTIWNGVQSYILPAFGNFKNALSPVFDGLSNMGNSFSWTDVLTGTLATIGMALNSVATVTGFVANNWNLLGPVIIGVATAVGIYKAAVAAQNTVDALAVVFMKKKKAEIVSLTLTEKLHAIATGIATGATTAFDAAMTFLTSPIFLVVAAIGAVIAIGVLLYKNWDSVCSFMKNAWQGVKNFFVSIGSAIGNFFSNLWGKVKEVTSNVWNGIKNFFVQFWPVILGIFTGGIGLIIGVVIQNWDAICNGVKTAWNSVKEFFVTIGTAIGTFFSNLWSGIKNAVASAFSFFTTAASTAWNGIVSVFSGVASWFGGIFSSAWNMVVNAFSGVVGFFQGIWNTIKNMFTTIGTAIANGISGAFRSVINSVISFAGNLINGFINSINWAIGVINKIPGVNITRLQTVNLPMLANGGNITRPGDVIVGERGPEMLHLPKGASVEPLDRKGGKTENKFYINIDARDKSPEEIANELVPKLKLALEVL